ncbi:hypothetical protein L873DRAFT_1842114 [Choiromyces venosus 120613-1]|uniref:Uncharacterized protein n=1 Tax=Choiromyces venosus 120613-1 TaxID=1336337 RepID=A0A3N4JUT1_9PEZI|nr:hypothetical protein L873DRAFT_1842114 [Choiromyces venosus 120613-1]
MSEELPQNITLRPQKRRRLQLSSSPISPPNYNLPSCPSPGTSFPSSPLLPPSSPLPPPTPSTPSQRRACYLATQSPEITYIIARHLNAYALTLARIREKERLSDNYYDLVRIGNWRYECFTGDERGVKRGFEDGGGRGTSGVGRGEGD